MMVLNAFSNVVWIRYFLRTPCFPELRSTTRGGGFSRNTTDVTYKKDYAIYAAEVGDFFGGFTGLLSFGVY